MFMSHPASTTTRGPSIVDENATTEHHRSKLSSNGMKKASFHDNNNNATTPHRNAKNVNSKSGGGQTTQRRRRAFGDISNRKVPGGGGNGAAGGKDNSVVLKRTSSTNLTSGSLKSTVSKPTTKVQFSTLPTSAVPNNTVINNAKSASLKSNLHSKSKQQQHRATTNSATTSANAATDDYEDVFSPTTRWAPDANAADNLRSPFYLVSDEEWNMVSNLREEFAIRTQKESEERIRLEIERDEARFMEKIREVNDDVLAMEGLCDTFDGLNALEDKLPWEVDEEEDKRELFDPTEERRLSGNDPCSLWGDISNW
ncbi:hypothetical protein ACHAWU_010101 [Discostella pseudostelligera]|uniref:Uncharacterized protein n=1 Tax=Discostella pseudostelligera TaxID=259834 RepID=A0ABD3MGU6_9STRA